MTRLSLICKIKRERFNKVSNVTLQNLLNTLYVTYSSVLTLSPDFQFACHCAENLGLLYALQCRFVTLYAL